YGVYGGGQAGLGRSTDEDQRHDQTRRIRIVAAVELSKRAALFIPSAGHDFFVDAVSLANPFCTVRRKRTLVGQPDTTIQSDPVHDSRVDEMLPTIAHLPDAGVGTLPVLAQPLKAIADLYPNVV